MRKEEVELRSCRRSRARRVLELVEWDLLVREGGEREKLVYESCFFSWVVWD